MIFNKLDKNPVAESFYWAMDRSCCMHSHEDDGCAKTILIKTIISLFSTLYMYVLCIDSGITARGVDLGMERVKHS